MYVYINKAPSIKLLSYSLVSQKALSVKRKEVKNEAFLFIFQDYHHFSGSVS